MVTSWSGLTGSRALTGYNKSLTDSLCQILRIYFLQRASGKSVGTLIRHQCASCHAAARFVLSYQGKCAKSVLSE